MAAFLRVINALQSIEEITKLLEPAHARLNASQEELLELAVHDLEDATLVPVGDALRAEAILKK